MSGCARRCGISARLLVACGCAMLLSGAATLSAPRADGLALVMEIRDAIGPATSRFFVQTLQAAQARHATVLVLELDTPGGLDSSMRAMIQPLLASSVPVVVFVAPGGSRAASAGTMLLYASHVAAMAPATNVGAATPVDLLPGNAQPPGAPQPPALHGDKDAGNAPSLDTHERKAINDAVAYIRSLAELRHRNADWAEAAVRQAASLSASQALAQHVIDLMANDLTDLLAQLDGRQVLLQNAVLTLATRNLVIEHIAPDWRTELLTTLTNPNLAYLLLLIGIFGLLAEGYHPGAVLPGVAGTICLLLALYSFQLLSVHYAGLALILLGVVLIGAEAYIASFGALGLGGVIALVIGSVMLLDRSVPGFAIARSLIGTMAVLGAAAIFGIISYAVRARARPVVTGTDQLLAATAVALGDFTGAGQVRVGGEIWQAVTTEAVRSGERLRIQQVKGLTLIVGRLRSDSDDTHQSGGVK